MNLNRKLLGGVISVLIGITLAFNAFAKDSSDKTALQRSIGVGLGESCVRPKEADDEKNYDMRKNHMKYLLAKRDKTMHEGIRTSQDSLKGCIDCHATVKNGKAVPVNAPGEFCAGCHTYAAVKLDCFECHATLPAKNSARLKRYLEKHPVTGNP